MYYKVPFDWQEQDEDFIEGFDGYTIADLRVNLLKLVQKNTIYFYCESLIIEDSSSSELDVAKILDYCQSLNYNLLFDILPFKVLLQLKEAKTRVDKSELDRQHIIEMILNLTVENTILRNSLDKFIYG